MSNAAFNEVWEELKAELFLSDGDLIMASAVISYTANKNGGTDITCRHCITGQPVTATLPVNGFEVAEWHHSAKLVQDAFPQLSGAQREFLLTGITDEEWTGLFGDEDDV